MSDELDELREARRELDAVIDEIRTVEGFQDFLKPPSFDDVARAAGPAPIVYLAAAEFGGISLVVHRDEVTPVELEALTADAVRRRLETHLATYAAYRNDRDAHLVEFTRSLDGICSWLWEMAMGPVLEALPGAGEATLVAGGLLGLMPLHAAWTTDDARPNGRRYALDEMPLSYAPNARVLAAARAVAQDVEPHRVLAVAEPWPVSGSRLRAATLEAQVCRAAFPEDPIVLPAAAATARRFTRSARNAQVLHLACHGFADLQQPLDSGLVLAHDEIVALRDVMALQLRVRLAVLSACETLLPGVPLPDEVVALPTGLLQAGVAGVVASMWLVPDRPTAMLMAEFYRRWRHAGEAPAAALRGAQRWLRDTSNGEKHDAYVAASDRDEWLPPDVTRGLMREVAFAEPEKNDHADIRVWGAFAHVGA